MATMKLPKLFLSHPLVFEVSDASWARAAMSLDETGASEWRTKIARKKA
jgi:hypothetical protein